MSLRHPNLNQDHLIRSTDQNAASSRPYANRALSNTVLRLVQPDDSPLDVLPFERRQDSLRKRFVGHVTGTITITEQDTDASEENRRQIITSFQLLDRSANGLGMTHTTPIPLDAQVWIRTPINGAERGEDLTGRVCRCTPVEIDGQIIFHIGLKLDHVMHTRSA